MTVRPNNSFKPTPLRGAGLIQALGAASDALGPMATLQLPTKLLIVGMAIGVAVVGIGYATTRYRLAQVETLVAECQTVHNLFNDPLVCDPVDLRRSTSDSPAVGIQAQIVSASSAAGTYFDVSLYLAALIAIVFAIPFAWYFLLRRIRELGDAIRGK